MCEGELQARPGVWLLLNSQVVGKGVDQLPGTIHVHLLTESYSKQVNATEEGR